MPSYSYFVRITSPWADVQRVVLAWSMRCDTIVAYEHADNVENIHCHIAITGSDVGRKQLRNIAAKQDVNVKGNERCSFKEYDEGERALVYMTKGELLPKYLKGYDQTEAEDWCKHWVNHKDKTEQDYWDKNWQSMITEFAADDSMYKDPLYAADPKFPECKSYNFYTVRDNVKKYVYTKHGGFHKPQTYNLYKCMMRGIIYEWSVNVPKGENSFW